MVFTTLAFRLCGKQFKALARVMKTNEYGIIGLILGITTTYAMFPLFTKMDTRGKLMNAGFSVGGAYLFSGQMAMVSSRTTGSEIAAYFAVKIIVGLTAVAVAYIATSESGNIANTLRRFTPGLRHRRLTTGL